VVIQVVASRREKCSNPGIPQQEKPRGKTVSRVSLVANASLLASGLLAWQPGLSQAPGATDAEWAAFQAKIRQACVGAPDVCGKLYVDFFLRHFPKSSAGPEESAGVCREPGQFWESDAVKKYAASSRQNGDRKIHLKFHRWAWETFGTRFGRDGCFDFNFAVRQWQRGVGHPESGRFTRADVDDYFARWDASVTKLDEYYAVLETELRAKLDEAVDAESDRVAALYASAPSVFGIQFHRGVSLSGCTDADLLRDFVAQTCFANMFSKRTQPQGVGVRFSRVDQPSWLMGEVGLILDHQRDSRVVGMQFRASNAPLALQAMERRFGAYTREVAPNAVVPAYIWRTEGLTAAMEEAGNSYLITISSDVFRKLKDDEKESRRQIENQKQLEQGRKL
jgi:hypothetical protein